MILWRTLSSAGRSISLLWILISNLSNVAVPSPQGDFLVVTLSFLVGSGIGPRTVIPDFPAISRILLHILFSSSMFELDSFILTLAMFKSGFVYF